MVLCNTQDRFGVLMVLATSPNISSVCGVGQNYMVLTPRMLMRGWDWWLGRCVAPTHGAVSHTPYPGCWAVAAYGGYPVGVVLLAGGQSAHHRADHLGGGAVVGGVWRGCGMLATPSNRGRHCVSWEMGRVR